MKTNLILHNTPLCLAPFLGFYYAKTKNELRPCCDSAFPDKSYKFKYESTQTWKDFWYSDYLKEIRAKLLDNKFHDICFKCKKLEEENIVVNRHTYNEVYKNLINKKIKNALTFNIETGNNYHIPFFLDYRPSNLCNLKCRMCDPYNSSEIAKEVNKNFEDYNEIFVNKHSKDIKKFLYKEIKKDNIVNLTLLKNLKVIKLLGGEPVIQPEVLSILPSLEKDVNLIFTTNAVNLSENFIKNIKNIKNISFNISIDGIYESYEYIRYPARWDTTYNNIIKLVEMGYNVKIKFVIQLYNVFFIKEIINFCIYNSNKYKLKYFFSKVDQDYLSINLLNDNDLSLIIDTVKSIKVSSLHKKEIIDPILNILYTKKEIRKESKVIFKNYTLMLDKIRKNNILYLHNNFKNYIN